MGSTVPHHLAVLGSTTRLDSLVDGCCRGSCLPLHPVTCRFTVRYVTVTALRLVTATCHWLVGTLPDARLRTAHTAFTFTHTVTARSRLPFTFTPRFTFAFVLHAFGSTGSTPLVYVLRTRVTRGYAYHVRLVLPLVPACCYHFGCYSCRHTAILRCYLPAVGLPLHLRLVCRAFAARLLLVTRSATFDGYFFYALVYVTTRTHCVYCYGYAVLAVRTHVSDAAPLPHVGLRCCSCSTCRIYYRLWLRVYARVLVGCHVARCGSVYVQFTCPYHYYLVLRYATVVHGSRTLHIRTPLPVHPGYTVPLPFTCVAHYGSTTVLTLPDYACLRLVLRCAGSYPRFCVVHSGCYVWLRCIPALPATTYVYCHRTPTLLHALPLHTPRGYTPAGYTWLYLVGLRTHVVYTPVTHTFYRGCCGLRWLHGYAVTVDSHAVTHLARSLRCTPAVRLPRTRTAHAHFGCYCAFTCAIYAFGCHPRVQFTTHAFTCHAWFAAFPGSLPVTRAVPFYILRLVTRLVVPCGSIRIAVRLPFVAFSHMPRWFCHVIATVTVYIHTHALFTVPRYRLVTFLLRSLFAVVTRLRGLFWLPFVPDCVTVYHATPGYVLDYGSPFALRLPVAALRFTQHTLRCTRGWLLYLPFAVCGYATSFAARLRLVHAAHSACHGCRTRCYCRLVRTYTVTTPLRSGLHYNCNRCYTRRSPIPTHGYAVTHTFRAYRSCGSRIFHTYALQFTFTLPVRPATHYAPFSAHAVHGSPFYTRLPTHHTPCTVVFARLPPCVYGWMRTYAPHTGCTC